MSATHAPTFVEKGPARANTAKTNPVLITEGCPKVGQSRAFTRRDVLKMRVMRPQILQILKMSPQLHCFHVVLSTYCFINVAGNMFLSIFTETTLKEYHGDGVYCERCKQNQPPRSWHCESCDACVIRRDHHCVILSHCIGRNNQRYFVCLLLHITTSMIYATYYNYFVVASKVDSLGLVIATAKILNPLSRLATREPVGMTEVYILFWYANLFFAVSLGVILYYHMRNIIRGVTAYESKKKLRGNNHWRDNFVSVFGSKWYLAVLWPFVASPLPESMN